MLPRTQTPRLLAPCRLQWQARRTNSSASGPRHRPENSTSPEAGQRLNLPGLKVPERSIFVKTSQFLTSPAESYAVIRAVEHKYGAVAEYWIPRDFEIETRFQKAIFITFRDPESFQRVSANGSDVIRVALPKTIFDRPGGIGLDELEEVLERQEFVHKVSLPEFGSVMNSVLQSGREEAENKNAELLECKITRSRAPIWTPSQSAFALISSRDITARNFVKWGGFQELKPIKRGTPIPDEVLFGPSSLDHVRMRRTIRKWSEMSGILNPYEYAEKSDSPPQVRQTTSPATRSDRPQATSEVVLVDPLAWEPLPGYESVAEEAPMPSVVQAVPLQTRSPQTAEVSTPPSTSNSLHPASDTPSLPPKIENEEVSDLPAMPMESLAETSTSPTPQLPTPNNATTHIPQANKAAQLKAARGVVNRIKPPPKKSQSKVPFKGPYQLPKKPKPAPAQEEDEVKNETVAGRLRGLFGGLF